MLLVIIQDSCTKFGVRAKFERQATLIKFGIVVPHPTYSGKLLVVLLIIGLLSLGAVLLNLRLTC